MWRRLRRLVVLQEIDAEWRANGSVESKRPGYMIANVQKMPRWPMQIIKDMRDKETGVLGVNAPFVDDYYKVGGGRWRGGEAGQMEVLVVMGGRGGGEEQQSGC